MTSVRPRPSTASRVIRTPSKSPPLASHERPAAARPATAYGTPGEAWGGSLRSSTMDVRGLPLSPQPSPPAGYMASTLGPGRADAGSTGGARRNSYTSLVLPDGRTALPGTGVGGFPGGDGSMSPYSQSTFARKTGTAASGFADPRPATSIRVGSGGGLRPASASRNLLHAAGSPSGLLRVSDGKGGMYSSFALGSSIASLPVGRPVRLVTREGGFRGDGTARGGVSPVFHDGTQVVDTPFAESPRPAAGTMWGRANGASLL